MTRVLDCAWRLRVALGLHRAGDREEGTEQAQDAAIAHELLSWLHICVSRQPQNKAEE